MTIKYAKSEPESALRQGELLSNVIETVADIDSQSESPGSFREISHPFAFIVSQDCDLDLDFAHTANGHSESRSVPTVLFCEAMGAKASAQQIVDSERSRDTNRSRIWARVKVNKDERYHFFEKIGTAQDLQAQEIDELVVDFKRYFTVPTGELYARISLGETKRRCRLVSPYLEHLSSRFAFYLSRVALPEDYYSERGVVKRRTEQ